MILCSKGIKMKKFAVTALVGVLREPLKTTFKTSNFLFS